MTGGNGNGERVGGIIGLGRLGKVENFRNHINHLLFIGTAVARDRLFNLVWRNFDKIQIMLSGGKQDDAASLRNSDSRRGILPEKKILDGYCVGIEIVDKSVELGKDFKQSVLHESLRTCGNDAVIDRAQLSAQIFNETKAANGSTRVNA